jgi:hypothetical protein
MIIFRVDRVHLGNQDFGHVMFLVRLVHDVPSDMRADAGIKDFFFEEGVNLQLGQGLIDDLCFPAGRITFVETNNDWRPYPRLEGGLNRCGVFQKHKARDLISASSRYLVYLNNRAAGKGSVKTIDLLDQKTAP